MDLKKFLTNQRLEIEKYKWIKGTELGRDPGEDAVKEWVQKNAAKYRKEYNDIYDELVHKTACDCKTKLKEKFPTVSDEIWEHFVGTVIESFTQAWTKEIACCKDKKKKIHLEEI